jgi:hypothetical protein
MYAAHGRIAVARRLRDRRTGGRASDWTPAARSGNFGAKAGLGADPRHAVEAPTGDTPTHGSSDAEITSRPSRNNS